jgi:hypothetical protein
MPFYPPIFVLQSSNLHFSPACRGEVEDEDGCADDEKNKHLFFYPLYLTPYTLFQNLSKSYQNLQKLDDF